MVDPMPRQGVRTDELPAGASPGPGNSEKGFDVGVTLNAQAEKFLALTAQAPPLDSVPVEQSRADIREIIPLTGVPAQLAEVLNTTVPGADGDVAVRVYRPGGDGAQPGVVYFHGGGWVIGDLDTHDATCRDLAAGSGATVVAVDFRRAPEHRFPAALDDALTVVRHLTDGAGAFGVDPARVAVAGDSAGGNLAAVVAQQMHAAGTRLAFQALIYPVTDAASVGGTASYREFGEGYFLTQRDMQFFVDSYAAGADLTDPRLSPLAAADLAGLPPAAVVLAEADPLRDEGRAYAERLRAAGVPVEVREFPGQVHPFVALGGLIDDAIEARRWLAERLKPALAAG